MQNTKAVKKSAVCSPEIFVLQTSQCVSVQQLPWQQCMPAVQMKTYLTNLFGSHISYLITGLTDPEELLHGSCQSFPTGMNWAIT